jgi:hypothetical protein
MKIYPEEIKRGLDQKILASQIVTAHCPVRKYNPDPDTLQQCSHYTQTEAGRAFAKYNDLYFVDTVLVTAGAPYGKTLGGFNKNDDYFPVEEVWRARATPCDKPTNIGHDPNLVCGHMVKSWVLTPAKGKIVPDSRAESDLPETIHLACSAVIYRDLASYYQSEISKMILQIEADEIAVSMECHFNEFDYALLDESTGEVRVVTRNEETAWMTWLLRWMGGSGYYHTKDKDGNTIKTERIGRALRDITFTGKGFVTNPANPDSIILDKSFEAKNSAADSKKVVQSNKLVAGKITVGKSNTNKGETKMSDIDPVQYAEVLSRARTADKLEKDNDRLQAKVEKLQEEAVRADKSIAAFEMGKKDYETLLEASKKEKEKDEKEKAELQELLKAAKDEKDKDEKDKKEKAETIAKLEKELAELKAAQQSAERQASLLKEGIEAKEAEAFVKTYASFTDDQFKGVAATKIEAHRTKAAFELLKTKGSCTAAELEKAMEHPVDAKNKDEDDKNKDDKGKKSKSSSFFGAFTAAPPKVQA